MLLSRACKENRWRVLFYGHDKVAAAAGTTFSRKYEPEGEQPAGFFAPFFIDVRALNGSGLMDAEEEWGANCRQTEKSRGKPS